MGVMKKTVSRSAFVAALLVATMAMNPKPLRAPYKQKFLKLSETSKSGAEGSNIQVNCTVVKSATPVELRWELSEEDNVRQERLSDTTVELRITSLKRTNAGQYTCLLIMQNEEEEKEELEVLVQQANDEVCTRYQFKCEKTRHCLFLKYRCDNKDDCGDGSDEQCDVDPCLNKFKCNNSRCIDQEHVCDHIKNCEDNSDEQNCNAVRPTSTAPPRDNTTYAWLQITVSSFIAVTLGLVFFISFIVIMVFRNRVRRLREQRIARALQQMYQEEARINRHSDHMGGPGDSPHGGPGQASDQQQFLLGPPQPHYGNIIVNVNNGVQYIPGYDYAIMVDVPPPYSEVGTAQAGEGNPPPPAYSTLEHQNMSRAGNNGDQPAPPSTDQAPGSASSTNSQPSRRCATVPAANVGGGESPAGAHSQAHQTSSPGRSVGEPRSHTGTLPSGIDINAHFLQSLLGPHTQAQDADRNSPQSTRDPQNISPTHRNREFPKSPAAQDAGVNIVHLAASPKHRGARQGDNSISFQQNSADRGGSLSTHSQNAVEADRQNVSLNHDVADGNLSDDDCTRSLLNPNSADDNGAPANSEEEEDLVSQNEDGTFLLRKPKHKARQENDKAEASALLPSTSTSDRNVESASNALLNEVSKRDDRLRPKPGHFTVQGGEILLHTPNGVLTDSTPAPPVPAPPADPSESPEAPELTIHNGALVFGSPKAVTPSAQSTHQSSQPGSSAGWVPEPELMVNLPESHHGTAEPGENEMSDTLHRKELQFKDGELVLESPKCTPSAQILSHLKGAYAEEEGMAEAIEPVVNTKRSGGAAAAKSQSQKFNSDVVLPPKSFQQ